MHVVTLGGGENVNGDAEFGILCVVCIVLLMVRAVLGLEAFCMC